MIVIKIILGLLCLFVIFDAILRYIGCSISQAMIGAIILIMMTIPICLALDNMMRIEKEIDKINIDIQNKSEYIYIDEAILNGSTGDAKGIIKSIAENGYVLIDHTGKYKVYRFEKYKK